jgi:hypothetical protein
MLIEGKELIITPAGFADVFALKRALALALKKDGINLDLSGFSINTEDPMSSEIGDIGGIIDSVLEVATDPDVQKWLFKCCERVLYGQNKVDIDFFEIPENRQYYYPIMIEVIKINLLPFFLKLNSLFANLPGISNLIQKSK